MGAMTFPENKKSTNTLKASGLLKFVGGMGPDLNRLSHDFGVKTIKGGIKFRRITTLNNDNRGQKTVNERWDYPFSRSRMNPKPSPRWWPNIQIYKFNS